MGSSENTSKIHILLNNFFISDSISTRMVPKWPPGPCHQSYVVFVFVGSGAGNSKCADDVLFWPFSILGSGTRDLLWLNDLMTVLKKLIT